MSLRLGAACLRADLNARFSAQITHVLGVSAAHFRLYRDAVLPLPGSESADTLAECSRIRGVRGFTSLKAARRHS